MCGIAGIVDYQNEIQQTDVQNMTQSLTHRGPDGVGHYFDKFVGLGHRRLAIMDLSDAGSQPMTSSCGRYTLVYNGEVYNYIELRIELVSKGYVFKGSSDSEVILYALVEHGVDALSKFNGMFALALWDNQTQTLLLARDRFGIKPLYYSSSATKLLFGSEIKAIVASTQHTHCTDLEGLHEYMWYGNTLGSATLHDNIQKVRPGRYCLFGKDGVKTETYWRIEDTPKRVVSKKAAVVEVKQLLDNAVKRHLLSDVPVGIFLSGGIDSSLITALASRHYEGKIKTYSVGFDFDKGKGELEKARLVADRFGTDHRELHVKADNLIDVLQSMTECHDEPFGDAANIPLYLLCRELKEDVKVVLQGDGGDEIFAGYRRYNTLTAEKLWGVFSVVGLHLQKFLPKTKHYDRIQRYFYAMSMTDPSVKMALLLTQDSLANSPIQLLSHDIKDQIARTNPFERYEECAERFSHLDPVQKMLYTDCDILLPNTYLEKVDKPTMANGIEIRVPLLDKELTDYVVGLPSKYKVINGQKKWLLRAAMRGVVPDYILDAPKTGFGVPFSTWLKKPLSGFMRDVLLGDTVKRSNYFNQSVLEEKISEHISGRRNNGYMLWKALMLGLWLMKFEHRSRVDFIR